MLPGTTIKNVCDLFPIVAKMQKKKKEKTFQNV